MRRRLIFRIPAILGTLISIPLLVSLGIWALFTFQTNSRLSRTAAEFRKPNVPMTFAEILHKEMPDEQNGSVELLKAISLLPSMNARSLATDENDIWTMILRHSCYLKEEHNLLPRFANEDIRQNVEFQLQPL